MAEEHQWRCPHPERWCCHSVPSLCCPPDDMEQQSKCLQKLLFTLTGHIFRLTMDEIEPICLRKCFNPSVHSFIKGAGNLPQWFWSDSIMQFLQSCTFMMGMRCNCGGNRSMAMSNKQRLSLNRRCKAGWCVVFRDGILHSLVGTNSLACLFCSLTSARLW